MPIPAYNDVDDEPAPPLTYIRSGSLSRDLSAHHQHCLPEREAQEGKNCQPPSAVQSSLGWVPGTRPCWGPPFPGADLAPELLDSVILFHLSVPYLPVRNSTWTALAFVLSHLSM